METFVFLLLTLSKMHLTPPSGTFQDIVSETLIFLHELKIAANYDNPYDCASSDISILNACDTEICINLPLN